MGMHQIPKGVESKRHYDREVLGRAYTVACLVGGAGFLYAGMGIKAAILLLGVLLHWAAVHIQR